MGIEARGGRSRSRLPCDARLLKFLRGRKRRGEGVVVGRIQASENRIRSFSHERRRGRLQTTRRFRHDEHVLSRVVVVGGGGVLRSFSAASALVEPDLLGDLDHFRDLDFSPRLINLGLHLRRRPEPLDARRSLEPFDSDNRHVPHRMHTFALADRAIKQRLAIIDGSTFLLGRVGELENLLLDEVPHRLGRIVIFGRARTEVTLLGGERFGRRPRDRAQGAKSQDADGILRREFDGRRKEIERRARAG